MLNYVGELYINSDRYPFYSVKQQPVWVKINSVRDISITELLNEAQPDYIVFKFNGNNVKLRLKPKIVDINNITDPTLHNDITKTISILLQQINTNK